MKKFEENMRVVVPAIITGTGEDKVGTVSKVETFLGKTIVSVSYDTPDALGNWGTAVTNTSTLKIMTKKKDNSKLLPQVEAFLKYREQHPDRLLLIDGMGGEKDYVAYREDAVAISKLLGIPLEKGGKSEQGMDVVRFSTKDAEKVIRQLVLNKLKVATAHMDSPQNETNDVISEEKKAQKPQLVTVNGDKVTHAHVFQSNKNPEAWFLYAKMNDKPLRAIIVQKEDAIAFQHKEIPIKDMMEKYYPTKMALKLSPEDFKAATTLSNGQNVDRFFVFKEGNPEHDFFGKWKAYAEVNGQKMAGILSTKDLNGYFDRVISPAQIVENTFGAHLHLASAYQAYKLPENIREENVRISKAKDGKWYVSVDLGENGVTPKKELSFDDGQSYFKAKTATREQLAAKYLASDIKEMLLKGNEQRQGLKI